MFKALERSQSRLYLFDQNTIQTVILQNIVAIYNNCCLFENCIFLKGALVKTNASTSTSFKSQTLSITLVCLSYEK